MKNKIVVCGFLLALAAGMGLTAEEKQPLPAAQFEISPAAGKIKVDGVLDEEAWKNCRVIKLPTEWTPGENTPAPVDTDCLVTYDRANIYVAFRCHDPEPQKIRAHLMDRDLMDTFIQDDHVSFWFDTFNDQRRAFQFRVNPLGVQADAVFSEQDGFEDFSWDAIWSSAARITADGLQRGESPSPSTSCASRRSAQEQTWGFSAERSWPRSSRHRMESHPRDRNSNCLLCQFNKIRGLAEISPGNNLEFDPTLTVQRSDSRADFPDGDLAAGKVKAEPGLTAKWGVTPNLILNATINPDFSQIEADAAQLDVNTRYALYYPEKRPFFLEGADFFLTPFEAVFTRTVADPLWGAKLTGKAGTQRHGLLRGPGPRQQPDHPLQPGFGGPPRLTRTCSAASSATATTSATPRPWGSCTPGAAAGITTTTSAASTVFSAWAKTTRSASNTCVRRPATRKRPPPPSGRNGAPSRATPSTPSTCTRPATGSFIGAYTDKGVGFPLRRRFRQPRRHAHVRFAVPIHVLGQARRLVQQRLFLAARLSHQRPRRAADRFAPGPGRGLRRPAAERGHGDRPRQPRVLRRHACTTPTTCTSRCSSNRSAASASGYTPTPPTPSTTPTSGRRRRLLFGPYLEAGLGRHVNLNLSHSLERLASDGRRTYTANLLQARLIYNFNVRAFARAIVQYRAVDRDPAALYIPGRQEHARPVHPAVVLLQAQRQDRPLPGLFRPAAGQPGHRPDPFRPHVFPQDRLRRWGFRPRKTKRPFDPYVSSQSKRGEISMAKNIPLVFLPLCAILLLPLLAGRPGKLKWKRRSPIIPCRTARTSRSPIPGRSRTCSPSVADWQAEKEAWPE